MGLKEVVAHQRRGTGGYLVFIEAIRSMKENDDTDKSLRCPTLLFKARGINVEAARNATRFHSGADVCSAGILLLSGGA